MRLLSVGFSLPNPDIDNHTFLNAPSFFDYDAVIVDPSAISMAIDEVLAQTGEMTSPAGQPVVNGPTNPAAAGLADVLRTRLAQTEGLLARGGVMLVIGHPNVTHPVSGFTGADRYFWLPAPAGLSWGPPDLVMGAGRGAVLADQRHPFAAYIDTYRSRIEYRAYFAESAALGRQAHVFARSHGGGVIGVDFALSGGHVVFLPAVPGVTDGMDRFDLARCLLEGARRTLGLPSDEEQPPWIASYALPGLEQREADLAEAQRALAEAEAREAEAGAAVEALAKYRQLLWQEGKYGLEPIVHDVLRMLGFDVYLDDHGGATLSADGAHVFVEIEGATGAIDMQPHYRLRERRERTLADSGELVPGLLVLNGRRRLPPQERDAQFAESVRIASESMGYGILTTLELFEAAQRVLAESDTAWLSGVRRQLLNARGPVRLQIDESEDMPSRPMAH